MEMIYRRRESRNAAAGTFLVAFFLASCAGEPPAPDLVRIYGPTAALPSEDRNPIVIVPALLGSILVDARSGATVWGRFGGDTCDPEEPEGARLVALPMAMGTPLSELRDEVVATTILDRVEVEAAGLDLEMEVYHDLLEVLGELGATVDGRPTLPFYTFPYDWRRDLVENARRLHEFLLARQREIGRPVRFDVVTHSAGALVVAYYLRHGVEEPPPPGTLRAPSWAGARLIERAILVAPPNAGTLRALAALVEGRDLGIFLPRYRPAILGTMPGIYPLLPRARHRAVVSAGEPEGPALDPLDPALWERMRWGLADPREEDALAWLLPGVGDPIVRRRIALDHLEKCLDRARRIQAALDAPSAPPPGTKVYLLGADGGSAPAVLGADPATGGIEFLEWAPGDGTVLRTSMLMDERVGAEPAPRLVSPIAWAGVHFVPAGHVEIARSAVALDNLLHVLLEDPR